MACVVQRLALLGLVLFGCSGEDGDGKASPVDAGSDTHAAQDGSPPDAGSGGTGGSAGGAGSAGAAGSAGSAGSAGVAGTVGAVDAGADAIEDAASEAAGCPSSAPGADSDGDGTVDADDCLPCDPNVHPNVTAWHSVPRSDGSWDYDCNGVEELEYPTAGKCAQPGCVLQQGFYKVPPCGGAGEKIAWCKVNGYSCTTQYESSGSSKQRCR